MSIFPRRDKSGNNKGKDGFKGPELRGALSRMVRLPGSLRSVSREERLAMSKELRKKYGPNISGNELRKEIKDLEKEARTGTPTERRNTMDKARLLRGLLNPKEK